MRLTKMLATRLVVPNFISLVLLGISMAGCGNSKNVPITYDLPWGRPVNTNPEYIQALYEQAESIFKVLDENGVKYWVDGGTLLGAVRHQGIIPWDDDIDICIAPGETNKFLGLREEFKKLHYFISEEDSNVPYKLRLEEAHNPHKIAPLDVFTTVKKNGKYYYEKWPLGHREGDNFFYYEHEVEKLKKWKFGWFEVIGIAEPNEYLRWQYGEKWNSEAVQDRSHRPEVPVKKVKFKLTEKDRKPGPFTAPLK